MDEELILNQQFVVKQIEVQELKNGKLASTLKTFLCVRDNQTGIVYPHPLTNYIRGTSGNLSHAITTQKRYAEEVKKFLNFILESIDEEDELFLPLEEKGIKKFKRIHGAKYLNFIKYRVDLGEIKPNAVYDTERLLTKFYAWLIEGNIIEEKTNVIYDKRRIDGVDKYIARSLFRDMELDVEFPARETEEMIKARKLHDFGDGKLYLVNLFLRVAELEAPEIALGIAFQFYAGLRRSEVVNLMRSSIQKPSTASVQFNIDVKDNWKTLFPDKEIALSEQVKKPRLQAVFKVNIVMELLKNHEERLKHLEKIGKIKNKHAYIISNQGNPISGKEYWKRFTKVRRRFLEIVLANSDYDYMLLTSKPWSTHIGRGCYTNMLIFLLKWNDSEVAIARGDSSSKSAQRYIEEMNVRNKTTTAIEELAKVTLDAEKKLNNMTI